MKLKKVFRIAHDAYTTSGTLISACREFDDFEKAIICLGETFDNGDYYIIETYKLNKEIRK
jgi:hypothetical protein